MKATIKKHPVGCSVIFVLMAALIFWICYECTDGFKKKDADDIHNEIRQIHRYTEEDNSFSIDMACYQDYDDYIKVLKKVNRFIDLKYTEIDSELYYPASGASGISFDLEKKIYGFGINKSQFDYAPQRSYGDSRDKFQWQYLHISAVAQQCTGNILEDLKAEDAITKKYTLDIDETDVVAEWVAAYDGIEYHIQGIFSPASLGSKSSPSLRYYISFFIDRKYKAMIEYYNDHFRPSTSPLLTSEEIKNEYFVEEMITGLKLQKLEP